MQLQWHSCSPLFAFWRALPSHSPGCKSWRRQGAMTLQLRHIKKRQRNGCQISDRSARATSPCAATAATAARTKAAVTAAGSEDSQRQPTNINLLCFLSYPRKWPFLDFFFSSNALPVPHCFVSFSWGMIHGRALEKEMKLFFVFILHVFILPPSFL